MIKEPLYTIGNLYTGYPWGVEAVQPFGTTDLYGPFSTENEANTFAHELAKADDTYDSVTVVRIETPQAGKSIIRRNGVLAYADGRE